MNINDAVQEIVKKLVNDLPNGTVFDSHLVIDSLRKNPTYYNVYLADSGNMTAAQYHGQIAQQIKKVIGVSLCEEQSYSMCIFEEPTPCALWKVQKQEE